MVVEEFQANPERKRGGEGLPPRFRSGFAWSLLAVATFVLFAHGCHGPDEDHEPSVAPIPRDSRD